MVKKSQVLWLAAAGLVVGGLLSPPRQVCAQDAGAVPWGQMIPTEQSRDRLLDDPTAGAVVSFDKGLITVGPGFKFTFERQRRVQIFRTDAYRFANVEIPYHSSEQIEMVEAHTLTRDGRKVEVPASAFYQNKTGEWRTLVFAFPEVSPGCVVEYRYKLMSRNFYYLRPWVFQNEVPTERSEVSVRLPEGFEYAAVLNNAEQVDGPDSTWYSSILHHARVREFTWRAHKLPPLTPEPCIASLLNHRALLDFQIVRYRDHGSVWDFVDSWSDLAGQVKRVYNPLLREDEYWPFWGKLPSQDQPVTSARAARRALAKRIFEFVRDSVAQTGTAVSVYDADLRPARTVFADRRGNGLEKNLLLVALLRHQGLPAWPVLISRRSHLRFDGRDHRLEQFDHAIALLELDGEEVFCESNVPGGWLGYLPPDDQVDAGVVIGYHDPEHVVVDLPAPPVDRDVVADGSIDLAPDGSATGRLNLSLSGQAAYELLCALADHDTAGYLRKQWLPQIVPTEITIMRDTDNDWAPITLSADFRWPEAATVDGKRLFVRPAIVHMLPDNPLMTAQRRYPISFDTPWSEDCRMVWHLPPGYQFGDLPAPRSTSGDGFEFRSSVTSGEDNTVIAERFWQVSRRDFSVRHFPELRDLFNTVQLSERGLVVLYRDAQ
ncbi:MAG: DUF3857 domain-containing protein [candidate division Zixibacteria bacterium]|nr:DUF3857 domain-containing protein [candidate division Zixibacteria bacterium]